MPPRSGNEPDVLDAVRSARRPRSETFHLGERLRQLRRERGMTLEDAGRLTALAASTLSKIENDQMSPTFDVVQKLAVGFDIDITELFASNSGQGATGRRSVTMDGAGRLMETAVYRHRLIAAELKNKKLLPFVTTIKARSLEDFKSWSQHSGEEFLYVLEGEICFQTEHYEPAILGVGDSIYINSSMQHACYSTSEQDAVVLWVNTG
ncbi:XRE family transcriptional regulator [Sphingopyxis sp. YF1]|jgi:transcriptional regulator with XRE-family HTH domain|uniref:helix-turn-helix domain-containing protein n=1 Tax=Sphingopyxis sp. YF1 TaxID=2482763 RepID=UPI00241636A4|nr:XRE family transcriptional regulator [Sphingopyxis sp. YF1]UNU43480.1 XRE family transcriptional regulator [Sphingopyxis sp. YF1]